MTVYEDLLSAQKIQRWAMRGVLATMALALAAHLAGNPTAVAVGLVLVVVALVFFQKK